MANANQLKMLVKAHYDNDGERFDTILIQVAASEAQKGHTSLARDLKGLIKSKKNNSKKVSYIDSDLEGIVSLKENSLRLNDLIVSEDISEILKEVINEYKNKGKLSEYGLDNKSKLLLVGNPGTGKTITASVLASELKLPLYVINTEKIMTKFLGESSQKLSRIFDYIDKFEAVYLFDEFDSLASERNFENDIGEMRRIINSLLQFIENNNNGFIIGATNNPQLLDQAIFRRFDEVLFYKKPDAIQREKLFKKTLGRFLLSSINFAKLEKCSEGLSHSEIVNLCKDSIKESILNNRDYISEEILLKNINRKKNKYSWEKENDSSLR